MHSQIAVDAYKLYLSFGGLHHREIEATMRAGGYPTFSRRVFYDRKERGKIYPGWIRKFNWNEPPESPIGSSAESEPPTGVPAAASASGVAMSAGGQFLNLTVWRFFRVFRGQIVPVCYPCPLSLSAAKIARKHAGLEVM